MKTAFKAIFEGLENEHAGKKPGAPAHVDYEKALTYLKFVRNCDFMTKPISSGNSRKCMVLHRGCTADQSFSKGLRLCQSYRRSRGTGRRNSENPRNRSPDA